METLVEKKVSLDNGRVILSPPHEGLMGGGGGGEQTKERKENDHMWP